MFAFNQIHTDNSPSFMRCSKEIHRLIFLHTNEKHRSRVQFAVDREGEQERKEQINNGK